MCSCTLCAHYAHHCALGGFCAVINGFSYQRKVAPGVSFAGSPRAQCKLPAIVPDILWNCISELSKYFNGILFASHIPTAAATTIRPFRLTFDNRQRGTEREREGVKEKQCLVPSCVPGWKRTLCVHARRIIRTSSSQMAAEQGQEVVVAAVPAMPRRRARCRTAAIWSPRRVLCWPAVAATALPARCAGARCRPYNVMWVAIAKLP